MRLLAKTLVVLSLSACGSNPTAQCSSACDQGYVCIDGACALVCNLDEDCGDPKLICEGGICVTDTRMLPPTVEISPADGSVGVALDTTVTLLFSRMMDTASVEAGFCLSDGTSCLFGSFLWQNSQTVIFTPSAVLTGDIDYSPTVQGTCRAASGATLAGDGGASCTAPAKCTTFHTQDGVPPTVTAATPSNGATNVAVNAAVVLDFSEAMDQASVEQAFSLADGTSTVAGATTWSGNQMTFTPSSALANDTVYSVTVAASARDLSGTGLAGVGGPSCAAPAHCTAFTTAPPCTQVWRCFDECGTGTCRDERTSNVAGCNCPSSISSPNCNVGVTYCLDSPPGCTGCCYERVEQTVPCDCRWVCQ